jgi:hypothetical protein
LSAEGVEIFHNLAALRAVLQMPLDLAGAVGRQAACCEENQLVLVRLGIDPGT